MKLPLVAVITLSSLLVAPAAFAQDANPGAQSRQTSKPGRLHTQERRAIYERIRARIRRALRRPSAESTRQTKPGEPRPASDAQTSPVRKPVRKPGLGKKPRKKPLGKKPLGKKPLGKKPGKPLGKPIIKKPRGATTQRTSQESPRPTTNPHPPAQTSRGNSGGLSGMIRGLGNETQEQGSRGAGSPR